VFTGGGVTFSSGADRSELNDTSTIERTTSLLSSILVRIEESPVPVVCRVNGAAFGAGLAIVARPISASRSPMPSSVSPKSASDSSQAPQPRHV